MLSQGEQARRLAVLAVLAGKRRILLLDEPIYGQDDAMTGEIMAMLAAKMREENLTIVTSTHDARLVEEWADSGSRDPGRKTDMEKLNPFLKDARRF